MKQLKYLLRYSIIVMLIVAGCSYDSTKSVESFNNALNGKTEQLYMSEQFTTDQVNDRFNQNIKNTLINRLSLKGVSFTDDQNKRIDNAIEEFRNNEINIVLIDVNGGNATQRVSSYSVYEIVHSNLTQLNINPETGLYDTEELTNLFIKGFEDSKYLNDIDIEMKLLDENGYIFSSSEEARLYSVILGIKE